MFVPGIAEGKDLSKRFSRAKFEALNDDFFTATIESVDEALRDAKLTKHQVEIFSLCMMGKSLYYS